MIGVQFFKNLSVAAKFVMWFLLIALVPLIIATYVSYESSEGALWKEAEKSLLAIADSKANKIENYLIDKKRALTTLSHVSEVIEATGRLYEAFSAGASGSADYRNVEEELRPFLSYYQKAEGYDDILIIGPSGDVIFSVIGKKEGESLYESALKDNKSELVNVFLAARSSAQTEISNVEYYPRKKQIAVYIASPVFRGNDIIGFVVAQVSNEGLAEVAGDYTSLGDTGETMLVTKTAEETTFITPLRFDSEAVFSRKVRIGSDRDIECQKAAAGESGSGRSIDYRNKAVLAVWRYLPTFRLGMVVKMDTSEVFTSARDLRNTLIKIAALILIFTVLAAFIIANSVASPIRGLTRIAGEIAGGNLEARVTVKAKDEIGKLAVSFNRMTDSLVEAKADVEKKKEEVEEQRRLLEVANKELDSFVYTVSHDLRAPLRGIEGFTNFIREDYSAKFDKEGVDYLERIIAGTQHMQKLIDDLLTLSRISRIMNPYENVDMKEVVQSVLSGIEFDIRKHNVIIKMEDYLPTVYCDKIKIREVFLNLINNAIKFSSKNASARPKVEIGWRDRETAYEFYVKDNGIGIDKKYHQEVFEIFRRLNKQGEYEGTGAGLSIVKRIINDHKGDVWVESEPGEGATFCFTIPKEMQDQERKEL